MRKKYLKLLFISMAVLLMVVGCSKKDDKTDDNQVDTGKLDETKMEEDGKETPDEKADPQKVELMNKLTSETASEDDFLVGVRSKDGDWHNIELIFTDEYAEELTKMSANEREAELKDYREKIYGDLAKSNVLFYESDDDTITFYYLDESGKEFIDKTEVKPD